MYFLLILVWIILVASQTCHTKTRSSLEEVPWHWIMWHLSHWQRFLFLFPSNDCHMDGYWSTLKSRNCPFSLAKCYFFLHALYVDSLVMNTSVYFIALHIARWWFIDNTRRCLLRRNKRAKERAGWSEIVCQPMCFTVTVFRVESFTWYVQFELMGHHVDQPQTQSKPMVWSDTAYKCHLFCLLYEMCYFAVRLLKNTFEKNNNVNVYSIWFSFFFFPVHSPRK